MRSSYLIILAKSNVSMYMSRALHPSFAPIHYLAIPKKEIKGISDLSDTNHGIIDHLMIAIKNEMSKKGIKDYRLVINNGSEAGQTVFHLHIHVLANRTLGWPPG